MTEVQVQGHPGPWNQSRQAGTGRGAWEGEAEEATEGLWVTPKPPSPASVSAAGRELGAPALGTLHLLNTLSDFRATAWGGR